jgi:hypothetical protein
MQIFGTHKGSAQSGLPDVIFYYQKYVFGSILKVLGIETGGLFFGRFEYYAVIWYT